MALLGDHKTKNNPFPAAVFGDFNAQSNNWYKNDRTKFGGEIVEKCLSQFKLAQVIIELMQILGLPSSRIDLMFISQPNLVIDSDNNANNSVAIINETILNCLFMIKTLLCLILHSLSWR